MNKQPYSWQQKIQGGVRWDSEKLLEPNLHVCGEDHTKIMVYNMRRWPTEGGLKNLEQKRLSDTSLKEELWTLD